MKEGYLFFIMQILLCYFKYIKSTTKEVKMKYLTLLLCLLSVNAFSQDVSCPEGTERLKGGNNNEAKSLLENGLISLVINKPLYVNPNNTPNKTILFSKGIYRRNGTKIRESELYAYVDIGIEDSEYSLSGWKLEPGHIIDIEGIEEVPSTDESKGFLKLMTSNHPIVSAISFKKESSQLGQFTDFGSRTRKSHASKHYEPSYLICSKLIDPGVIELSSSLSAPGPASSPEVYDNQYSQEIDTSSPSVFERTTLE